MSIFLFFFRERIIKNMNVKLIAGVGGIIGVLGLAYAHKITKQISVSLNTISDKTVFKVSEALVDKAINRSVDKEVGASVQRALITVENEIERDINRQIKSAIDTSYSQLKYSITKNLAKQAANINMQELKDEVIAYAKEHVLEKFDNDLEDISESYKQNLESIGKIYNSMATKFGASN